MSTIPIKTSGSCTIQFRNLPDAIIIFEVCSFSEVLLLARSDDEYYRISERLLVVADSNPNSELV